MIKSSPDSESCKFMCLCCVYVGVPEPSLQIYVFMWMSQNCRTDTRTVPEKWVSQNCVMARKSLIPGEGVNQLAVRFDFWAGWAAQPVVATGGRSIEGK